MNAPYGSRYVLTTLASFVVNPMTICDGDHRALFDVSTASN